MKKKVVLIRTPFVFPLLHFSSITAVPDIGTAYINGTLKHLGYDSQIIDAAGEGIGKRSQIKGTRLAIGGISAEEILKKIPEDVQYVGVQSMHSNRWVYDSHIIKTVLENFPNVKIFLGGEHVSAAATFILKEIPQIAACVIGEGEETLVELMHAFENGYDLADIKGIAYVDKDGNVVENERRKRRSKVDDIPLPDWSGVPIQNYIDNNCGINSLSRKSMPVLATRGCPYSCTFCTVPNMWDSKWFARDPESIVGEIAEYVQKFGINHVDFVDLTLVINKKWMHRFCDLLIEANMDLTWAIPIGTRTESLDVELLQKMKKSGLNRVLYSAESGSEDTLDRINKCLKIDNFKKVVRATVKEGICVKIAFILGFPGQTLREVWHSFKLVNQLVLLGANDIVCLSFVPYPKTTLYDELELEYDFNSIENNIRLNNDIPTMKSWSDHFGDKTLRFLVVFFMLYFYAFQSLLHPKRFVVGMYRVFIKKLPLTNFESLVFNAINSKKLERKLETVELR